MNEFQSMCMCIKQVDENLHFVQLINRLTNSLYCHPNWHI